ncbi:hypothetical protein BN77_2825 [Rhizobium mesoamericanum STM3625]|uniref:Uncharacterized protein n=1 Tax=Rhizobium mesoamericanum STM3625 TaxID=1211777 RepID=K0PVU5_9HYPH|nr:hypothetical protein BN77_2825 [Rhizobium mesoamericanum STM3625]
MLLFLSWYDFLSSPNLVIGPAQIKICAGSRHMSVISAFGSHDIGRRSPSQSRDLVF